MKPPTVSNGLKDIIFYQRIGWTEDPALRHPASLIERWYAAAIDYAFFLPFYLVFKNPVERKLELISLAPDILPSALIPLGIFAIPWTLYFLVPTFLWGQTLGKAAVGLRVVAEHGLRSLFQILVRESIGKLLAVITLLLGVLMALVHPKGKMLHDVLAQTLVLKTPRSRIYARREL